MISIYTYPNNSGTGYIDPLYYGATTPAAETGYYRRISELKNGAYKPWVTGMTAPVDTVSDLITATGEFYKGIADQNPLENIQIYSYWHTPLILANTVIINTDVTASDTDAVPAVRLTVNDSSDLVDSDIVLLSGFDGTLASQNGNSYYTDIINSTTVDLYYNSALTQPLAYVPLITGQQVYNINYSAYNTYNTAVQVTLTGLGANSNNGTIDFDFAAQTDPAQSRLYDIINTTGGAFNTGIWLDHIGGEVFNLHQTTGGGNALTIDEMISWDNNTFSNYDLFGDSQSPLTRYFPTYASPLQYRIPATGTSPGKLMYRCLKYTPAGGTYNSGPLSALPLMQAWEVPTFGGFGDIPAIVADANLSHLGAEYHWGPSTSDTRTIGFGFYARPQFNAANEQVNIFKKMALAEPSHTAIYLNWDGLSEGAGGQSLSGGSNTYDGNKYFYGGNASGTQAWSKFYDSGKDLEINSLTYNVNKRENYFGSSSNVDTINCTLSENAKVPFGAVPTAFGGSAAINQYFNTTIQWNPLDANDMFPESITLEGPHELVAPSAGYPEILRFVDNYFDSQYPAIPDQSHIYADISLSPLNGPTPTGVLSVVLVPASRSVASNRQTVKFAVFDPRMWDSTYGDLSGVSGTYPVQYSGAKANFAENPYGAFSSPLTRSDFISGTSSGTGTWSGGNIAIYTDGTAPYEVNNNDGTSYIYNLSPFVDNSTQFTIPNTVSGYEKFRNGVQMSLTYPANNVSGAVSKIIYLKLVAQDATSKTFTMHQQLLTTGANSGVWYVDWLNNWSILTTSTVWYNVGTLFNTIFSQTFNGISPGEYWMQQTSIDDWYLETDSVSFIQMEATEYGTTATIGQTVVDSTTGNIALGGTNNAKVESVDVYFPGDQTYQQRTGSSTYVNGAVVSDLYYPPGTATTESWSDQSQIAPVIDITQSTEGYISGVTLVSSGRVNAGTQRNLLKIDTLPDTYTPPTPTPAEAEDVWDTEDQWASDGSTTPGKYWPDHVTPMSAEINYNSPTITNNSQSGIKYTRSAGHTKWQLDVVYPPMSAADFKEFNAIAQAAHGQSTPFYFNLIAKNGERILWKDFYDQNNTTITPRFKDDIVAGDTLALFEGFSSNEPNAFMQGEVFIDGENENGALHTSLSGTAANVYGEAKIRTPWPFRQSQLAGQQVYKDPQHAIVTLGDDNFTYSVDVNNYYYVSVSFDLDSWK